MRFNQEQPSIEYGPVQDTSSEELTPKARKIGCGLFLLVHALALVGLVFLLRWAF